jgi:Co/Zn/Cd efflux system component
MALVAGRYLGWAFLDPVTGVLGGVLILRWSTRLCGTAARQLVDATSPPAVEDALRAELEQIDDVRVSDLHVWDLAPGRQSCVVSLTASSPRATAFYRERILARARLAHLTVEVHRSEEGLRGSPGDA